MIELLTVIGIMSLLAVVSIPAYNSMTKASNLTTTAQEILNQLNQAQQTALTRNATVEVRFYRLPDYDKASNSSLTRFRGMQLFILDSTGVATALNKPYYFPQWIVTATSPEVASLLNDTDKNGIKTTVETTPASTQKLGAFGANYSYRSFSFKPGGNTNLSSAALLLLTVVNQKDATSGNAGLPLNYVTIQIDAMTGRVRIYHP